MTDVIEEGACHKYAELGPIPIVARTGQGSAKQCCKLIAHRPQSCPVDSTLWQPRHLDVQAYRVRAVRRIVAEDYVVVIVTLLGCSCKVRVYSPYDDVQWEKRWEELSPGDLPRKFGAVVKELEEDGPAIVGLIEEAARRREEEVRRWRAERDEWAIREAARKRVEADKKSRQDLLTIVQKWSLACQIEAFFKDLERRAAEGDEASRAELAQRLERARALLGGIDPLAHFEEWASPEELLSDT